MLTIKYVTSVECGGVFSLFLYFEGAQQSFKFLIFVVMAAVCIIELASNSDMGLGNFQHICVIFWSFFIPCNTTLRSIYLL